MGIADKGKCAGVISVELVFSLIFLLVVFVVMMHFMLCGFLRFKLENQATIFANQAARLQVSSGSTHKEDVFDGKGTAVVIWGDELVEVSITLNNKNLSAHRLIPRVLP